MAIADTLESEFTLQPANRKTKRKMIALQVSEQMSKQIQIKWQKRRYIRITMFASRYRANIFTDYYLQLCCVDTHTHRPTELFVYNFKHDEVIVFFFFLFQPNRSACGFLCVYRITNEVIQVKES